ncbi:IclR family transcriptional regulator [Cupriavidus numazuensis]|uniref:HTH-type transcriptional regulator TsaQ1/TsaQ2 n=1 Tax=Cupriavidus numazuensis TaxID=221992 RepID=A0ABM8TNT0_9BURK|nr:IclR family transcriptional regulator [Cupriavidus numazuensis]CAG2156382.1 HTH-type transcriptional regulator TsaQ1/TsaQ2 [Cupriavidus numazuensis]
MAVTNDDVGRDRQFATTLSHGLDILLAFRVGDAMLGNRDFVQRTGLSKSAVSRLTHTLTLLGFLRHDRAQAKYRLGAPALAMSYPLLAGLPVRQVARPMMKALADQIGGAVSLGLRDRIQMIYIETARSTDNLLLTPDIGAGLPMLTTAMGRAWLCHAPAGERDAVLNRLRLADADAVSRALPLLARARESLASKGYCTNRAEWRHDGYGLAVPLCKPIHGMHFVLNCGVPVGQESFGIVERRVAPGLLGLARSIESAMGLVAMA